MRAIVIDTGEKKEALAKRIGAEAFIDFKKVDNVAAEVVKTADGIGAHGVVVTAWQTYKGILTSVSIRSSRAHSDVYRLDLLHWPPHRRRSHEHRPPTRGPECHTGRRARHAVLFEAPAHGQYRGLHAGRGGLSGLCETRAVAVDL